MLMITAEEYKNLIEASWLKDRLEQFLEEQFKIEDEKLKIKDNWDFANSFEEWLKTIDRKMYMKIFNKLKK
jgi:hypothetical protein